jgi:hypothetical protein
MSSSMIVWVLLSISAATGDVTYSPIFEYSYECDKLLKIVDQSAKAAGKKYAHLECIDIKILRIK